MVDWNDRVYVGVTLGVMGVLGGMMYQEQRDKPVGVYVKDLRGDGHQDMVVCRNSGGIYIFMQLEDGRYVTLSDWANKQNELTESKVEKIKNRAENIK